MPANVLDPAPDPHSAPPPVQEARIGRVLLGLGDVADQRDPRGVGPVVDPVHGVFLLGEGAEGRGLERPFSARPAFDPGAVAHRHDAAPLRVAVFDRGRIVEVGRPADLLAAGGRFRDLAELQIDARTASFAAEVRG